MKGTNVYCTRLYPGPRKSWFLWKKSWNLVCTSGGHRCFFTHRAIGRVVGRFWANQWHCQNDKIALIPMVPVTLRLDSDSRRYGNLNNENRDFLVLRYSLFSLQRGDSRVIGRFWANQWHCQNENIALIPMVPATFRLDSDSRRYGNLNNENRDFLVGDTLSFSSMLQKKGWFSSIRAFPGKSMTLHRKHESFAIGEV